MRSRKIFIWITVLCIAALCIGCAPAEEVPIISSSGGGSVPITKEAIYEFSTYILQGTVVEKTAEYFNNPDGSKKGADGTALRNVWITEYAVQIHRLFKGECKAEFITVRTYNGADLSPEEFRADGAENFYLQVGKECVLSLYEYEDQAGYGTGKNIVPLYGAQSYFLPTETKGVYTNAQGLSLAVDTLAKEIK